MISPEKIAAWPEHASPLPWSYVRREDAYGGHDWIEDATGGMVVENVGHIDGPAIVAAVNSYSELRTLRAERDEARELVTEANNSLYGSQGYFHSLNGGPFDKYHLANGIEKLKETSRAEWRRAEAAEAQLARHGEATHRHKKRGSEYVLIGIGKMQAEEWFDAKALTAKLMSDDPAPEDTESVDMREVAIYRSVEDGSLWVRPREEFEDGRFEEIARSTLSPEDSHG